MTQPKRNTVETLLGKGVSQHEIHRKTGIDRKTIRKIVRAISCEFRPNLDTDSSRNWTVIPRQSGHGFQSKLDSPKS